MNALMQLKALPLLRGLPEDQLYSLAEHALDRTFPPGARIVSEDEAVRTYFIVISGRVKVFKSSMEGKEQTLYIMGPGEPLGLCTAFGDRQSPVSAQALEESRLLLFPGGVLEEMATSEPSLMLNMLLVISRRLRESMSMIEALALQEMPQRLAGFLLHSLRTQGDERGCGRSSGASGSVVQLGVTQRELAKILGTTPETLNRVLKRMHNDGLLEVQGRDVRIHDLNALEEAAAGR